MAEALPSLSPIPFRHLVDRAMHEARRSLRTLWWPFALPLAFLGGLIGVASVLFNTSLLGAAEAETPGVASIVALVGALFLVALVMGYVYFVFFAAVVRSTGGDPEPLRGVWRFCLRPRFVGTMILVGLCCFAGVMMCILPVLWVGLVLSFVVPAMVQEEVFGRAALRRSYDLVRYNPHRRFVDNPMVKIFLLMVIGWVLSYAVSIVLTLPFTVIQQVMFFREAASGGSMGLASAGKWMWLSVPGQILGTLGSSAVQLYLFFGLSLLFFDCRRRKEGQDLEEAVSLLEELHPVDPLGSA